MAHYNRIRGNIFCNHRGHCHNAISSDAHARLEYGSSPDNSTVFNCDSYHLGAHRIWVVGKRCCRADEYIASYYGKRRNVDRAFNPCIAANLYTIVNVSQGTYHYIVSYLGFAAHIGKMPYLDILAHLGITRDKIYNAIWSDITVGQCFRDAMDSLVL